MGFELVSLLRNRRVREFKALLRSVFGMLATLLNKGPGVMPLLYMVFAFPEISYARCRAHRQPCHNFPRILSTTSPLGHTTQVMGAILPGVANEAHLGGLLAGVLVSFFVSRRSGCLRENLGPGFVASRSKI